jgi:hypothetical protein
MCSHRSSSSIEKPKVVDKKGLIT